jgi:predicted AlkP superfamily pyrophosphatase or phosphodiesterase
MRRTVVFDVVGLTPGLLRNWMPRLKAFADRGAWTTIIPAFPGVTCTAQSDYVTGRPPAVHGIVGNGWYDREQAEVQFWRQSDHLVGGRKIWESCRMRDRGFTCAKLFWWYNMYSTADYSITPRPLYPADGRKVFDIHTWPYHIRSEIKRDLGEFPFATFWGPAAGVPGPGGTAEAATRWIGESAKWIEERYEPTLSLVYLPHLDYGLQRLGPADPAIGREAERVDAMLGDWTGFFEGRGVEVILLSEYGIVAVNTPVHLNRLFRQRRWLALKEELGWERLDAGASRVFAVADHQIAHVYLNDPALEGEVRTLLESIPGVARVLDRAGKRDLGLDHGRAGDLVAVAASNAWFTYYYWLDDRRAPDFARTVDIHRKPGYDPVELFLDPRIPLIRLKILWRLLQKRLGFRMLMDVIPLDPSLVRGSHGARPGDTADWPVLIRGRPGALPERMESTAVHDLLLEWIGPEGRPEGGYGDTAGATGHGRHCAP